MSADASERPVLVSACLLGRRCRYDGRHSEDEALPRELFAKGERAVPFCPEEEGRLGTPRPRAWMRRSAAAVLDGTGRVVTDEGHDVTTGFLHGAQRALEACRAQGIDRAYLKERSPSCGVRNTHVDGELVQGPGLTAELLGRDGVETLGVPDALRR